MVGCSAAAAAEHLCSQRLPVRISAVQLLCSSQLTKTGTIRTEVELSHSITLTHIFIHKRCVDLLSLVGVAQGVSVQGHCKNEGILHTDHTL